MREKVVLHPGQDGFWVAECPSLPGCVSQGETREDAIRNIKEAIEGYILALQDDGLAVPEETFQTFVVAVSTRSGCGFPAAMSSKALCRIGFHVKNANTAATLFFDATTRLPRRPFPITRNWIAAHSAPFFAIQACLWMN